MIHRTIEEELAVHNHSFFQTVGSSMEPLLHNRKSTVVIAAKQGRLNRYDVALYCKPTGEYILHRVIKVLDGSYLIRGDNCVWDEIVPDEQIIGVMTAYYPNEHSDPISCNSKVYQKYLKTLWWRYVFLKIRSFLWRIRRKLASWVRDLRDNKKIF